MWKMKSINKIGNNLLGRGWNKSFFNNQTAFRKRTQLTSLGVTPDNIIKNIQNVSFSNSKAPLKCMRCTSNYKKDKVESCEFSVNENEKKTSVGICGKTEHVSRLNEVLVHYQKGIAMLVSHIEKRGGVIEKINEHLVDTLSLSSAFCNHNVNRIKDLLQKTSNIWEKVEEHYLSTSDAKGNPMGGPSKPTVLINELLKAENDNNNNFSSSILKDYAAKISLDQRINEIGLDEALDREFLTAAVQGTALVAKELKELKGKEMDAEEFRGFSTVLNDSTNSLLSCEELIVSALSLGELNLRYLESLQIEIENSFGPIESTSLSSIKEKMEKSSGNKKAILVSGSSGASLKVLQNVLEATKNKDIDVYTHDELLVAHSMHLFKNQYEHLRGHFGTTWAKQNEDFSTFPGFIVACGTSVQDPNNHEGADYLKRMFTSGMCGINGVQHLDGLSDMSDILLKAVDESKDVGPNKFENNDWMDETPIGLSIAEITSKIKEGFEKGLITQVCVFGGKGFLNVDDQTGIRKQILVLFDRIAEKKSTVVLSYGSIALQLQYLLKEHSLSVNSETGLPLVVNVGPGGLHSIASLYSNLCKHFGTDASSLPQNFFVPSTNEQGVSSFPDFPQYMSTKMVEKLNRELNFGVFSKFDVSPEELLINRNLIKLID